MSGAPAADDPIVTISLPLSGVNFVIGTLDMNPLKASTMQVAGLISGIKQQTEDQLSPKATAATASSPTKKSK